MCLTLATPQSTAASRRRGANGGAAARWAQPPARPSGACEHDAERAGKDCRRAGPQFSSARALHGTREVVGFLLDLLTEHASACSTVSSNSTRDAGLHPVAIANRPAFAHSQRGHGSSEAAAPGEGCCGSRPGRGLGPAGPGLHRLCAAAALWSPLLPGRKGAARWRRPPHYQAR